VIEYIHAHTYTHTYMRLTVDRPSRKSGRIPTDIKNLFNVPNLVTEEEFIKKEQESAAKRRAPIPTSQSTSAIPSATKRVLPPGAVPLMMPKFDPSAVQLKKTVSAVANVAGFSFSLHSLVQCPTACYSQSSSCTLRSFQSAAQKDQRDCSSYF
jgi:hypothetical protein